jgi:hypothetical protein
MITAEELMQYVNSEAPQINGWFYPPDMISFWCIDFFQRKASITGSTCEVGVYEGKSLALLSKLTDSSESCFGIDLFEGNLKDTAQANLEKFAPNRHVQLISADTSKIQTHNLNQLFVEPLRILHIDAGHEYHEVMHQLALFSPYVKQGGVIILDDYHDREFPGIEAAVYDFAEIDRPRRFVPFLMGANKAYLCEKHMASEYQKGLLQHDVFSNTSRTTRIRDFTVLVGFSKSATPSTTCLSEISNLDYPLHNQLDNQFLATIAHKNREHRHSS